MWAGPSLLSQSHSSLIRRPIQSDMFYSAKRSKALQHANRKMLQKHNRSPIQRKEKGKKNALQTNKTLTSQNKLFSWRQ